MTSPASFPSYAGCVALRAGVLLAATVGFTASVLAADDVDRRIRIFETSLRQAVSIAGEPEHRWTLSERMRHWNVPGLSIAVIRDGKVAWAKGYGVLQAGGEEPIDTETMFSVGSMSKVGASAVTLRLVDAGTLDLDRNVNDYLTRWKIPDTGDTAARPVTLRGILSHTAGLTVHGFADYLPGEALPTVVDTLEGRAPAKNKPVSVFIPPGIRFVYSGGGTTVEQLIIEDVTGMSFPQAAHTHLFAPLGMTRSSYENPLPEAYGNIAKAHDRDGRPVALPRGYEAMPEMAASGLWTTPSDYARLVISLITSYQGAPNAFLSPALARQMMTEVGRSPAGLGPFLEGQGMERRFSHGGANDSYRTWMEGHLATGNGVVILTNGANGDSLYQEVRRAVALAEGWPAALSYHTQVPKLTLPADELRLFAGVYDIVEVAQTTGIRSVGERSDAAVYHVLIENGALRI